MNKNGRLFSCNTNNEEMNYLNSMNIHSQCDKNKFPFILEYKIGEETKPNKGYIFVFDSLDNVIKFKSNFCWHDSELYECEINKLFEAKKIAIFNHNRDDFWNNYYENRMNIIEKVYGVISPPDGTLFTDSVKLIKKVDINDCL